MKKAIVLLTLAAATACAVPAETAGPPGQAQSSQPGDKSTATPKPKRWVTVAKLAGSGNKRGPAFHLGDSDARLIYQARDTSGIGAISLAVYIIPKGDSLERSGGFPEIMADEAGKDSTQLAKDPGDYYLDIQGANAKWSVAVQQKR